MRIRPRRGRRTVVYGALCAVSVLWIAVWSARSQSPDQLNELLPTLPAMFAGGIGLATQVTGAPVSLAEVSDAVADRERSRLRRVAWEWGLRNPRPIQVRWTVSRAHGVPPTAGGPFPPVPELPDGALPPEEQGGLDDLFGVYGAHGPGRVAVLGAPGCGKSAAAVLTALRALEHREALEDGPRARTPVPVLLDAAEWPARRLNPRGRAGPDRRWSGPRPAPDHDLGWPRPRLEPASAGAPGGRPAPAWDAPSGGPPPPRTGTPPTGAW